MQYFLMITFSFFIILAGNAQPEANFSNSKNNQIMMTQAQKSIEVLLKSYEAALNASDTEAVLKLYAEDGVFMPSEAPTSLGKTQVEAAYNYVFSQIKLNIEFAIDEIEVAGEFAFARTISRGTTDVLAAGITVPEENRELFVLKKVKDDWKIARYIFNKMSPPQN